MATSSLVAMMGLATTAGGDPAFGACRRRLREAVTSVLANPKGCKHFNEIGTEDMGITLSTAGRVRDVQVVITVLNIMLRSEGMLSLLADATITLMAPASMRTPAYSHSVSVVTARGPREGEPRLVLLSPVVVFG